MQTSAIMETLIRNELRPGDLGLVIYKHATLYKNEYNYGLHFESYVAGGLHEFYESIGSSRSRAWVCEQNGKMVGFLALVDRGKQAQLRYFILDPSVRGSGLGKKLMNLYVEYLKSAGFEGSFLLTTNEQKAAAHLYTSFGFKLVEEHPTYKPFDKDVMEQRYEMKL